jgi:hypothetical protein
MAWGGVLLLNYLFYPLDKVASVVVGIIGVEVDKGYFLYIATLALPILYSLCGVYIGSSVKKSVELYKITLRAKVFRGHPKQLLEK